jgi:hypothetical protein
LLRGRLAVSVRRSSLRSRFVVAPPTLATLAALAALACSKARHDDASRAGTPAATLAAAVVDAAPPSPILIEEPKPAPHVYRVVLHTGDSTVGGGHGLARALKGRFEADGATYVSDTVNSATLLSLEAAEHLADSVAKHQPDLVLINLGTNEVFVPAPQALLGRIRAVVKNVGPRDCIWIGPPTWKGDKGIVAVLRENVAPCRFFDSSDMDIERISDGIHPTDKGGEQWGARFWSFFHPA